MDRLANTGCARLPGQKAQAFTVAEILRAAWLPHDGLAAPPTTVDDSGWQQLAASQWATEPALLDLQKTGYTWVLLEMVGPRPTHRSASIKALLWGLA